MRKVFLLLILLICAFSLISCKDVDPDGFVKSSDVDDRFNACDTLPEKSYSGVVPVNFSFIVISDTHVYHGSHNKLTALKEKVLPGDRFILVCGDVTQCGYEEDYDAFCSYMNAFGLPYFTTIGNHDLYNGGWNHYRTSLGKSCYTFTAGTARFVAIDSANGTIGEKQKVWLENILKTKTEPLCFVFTHFDFFNPGFTDKEENYYLMHLFKSTHVGYVFMGHTHDFYHKKDPEDHPIVNYINVPDFVEEGTKDYIRVSVNGTDVSFEKIGI